MYILIEGFHCINLHDWSTITVTLQHKYMYILQLASCLHAQQVNMDLTRLYNTIVTINKIIIILETCACILLYVDPGEQGQ